MQCTAKHVVCSIFVVLCVRKECLHKLLSWHRITYLSSKMVAFLAPVPLPLHAGCSNAASVGAKRVRGCPAAEPDAALSKSATEGSATSRHAVSLE